MKNGFIFLLVLITISSCNRFNQNKPDTSITIQTDGNNTQLLKETKKDNQTGWKLYPVSKIANNEEITLLSSNSQIVIPYTKPENIKSKQAVIYSDGNYKLTTIIDSNVETQDLINEYIKNSSSNAEERLQDKHLIIALDGDQTRLTSINNIGIKVETTNVSDYSLYRFNYLFKYNEEYIKENSANSEKEQYLKDVECVEHSLLIGYQDAFYLYDLNTLGSTLKRYYAKSQDKYKVDPKNFIYSLRDIKIIENNGNTYIHLSYSDTYPYCYSIQHGVGSSIKSTLFKLDNTDMSLDLIIDYIIAYYPDCADFEKITDDASLIQEAISKTKNISNDIIQYDYIENQTGHGTKYNYTFNDSRYNIESYNYFTHPIDPNSIKHDER